ncbi:MAG: methionine--tRNA ligase [Bosea sp. (in: a-proteobacteria)]|nr:methionine--tRNA ligase [Bosea sp. (in: a-proteobacteria)]
MKHLGNFAGSLLPADIHARFRRQIGDEVLFICATDEHGTPAELAAAEAGREVADFCREQHEIQAAIYSRLDLSFDHFGRSSSSQNHVLTQHFFHCLDENGFIEERVLDQVYSPEDRRFLPDRYIIGTCPHCGFERARGDQCEHCTRPLDPVDLIAPRSALSGSDRLEIRPSRHLFLRQSALVGELETWIASRKGWPPLVTSIARKWLNEGIQDRCITRDLDWGVPVPKPGFEGKVFYVWFDAPIAYIAATQEWCDAEIGRDWRQWWWDAHDVDYRQFLGKDNVPFHAVSFPCTLLGSREPWKTVDVVQGVNWLTYEGGKFSTSQRRGIFLDQALALLPADYWRWWLASNAPESSDTDFTFERFAADINHDLSDTSGNFVSRTLKFVESRYGGIVPGAGAIDAPERELSLQIEAHLASLRAHHENLSVRKAAEEVRQIWRLGNGYLAREAPWSTHVNDPVRTAVVIRTAVTLIEIAAQAVWSFIPATAERVLAAVGHKPGQPGWPTARCILASGGSERRKVAAPPPLFPKLASDWVEIQKITFRGST